MAHYLAAAALPALSAIVFGLGVDAQYRPLDCLRKKRAGQGYFLLPEKPAVAGMACSAAGDLGGVAVAQTVGAAR